MSAGMKNTRMNALLQSIKEFNNEPVLANRLLKATNKNLTAHHKMSNTKQMGRVVQAINLRTEQILIKPCRVIKKVDGATVTYTYYQVTEEIKIPEVTCLCGKKMKATHKTEKDTVLKEVRYKCVCGITALALINKDTTFDLYFHRNKKMIHYALNVSN